MIRITEQYIWQLVFAVFFGLLVIMGAIILDTEARILLSELGPIDFILITLASWRVTRLFVYDTIMKWFREQFFDAKRVEDGYVLQKPVSGPRRTLNELMTCPWCFGLWASAMVSFFYLLTDFAVYPVIFLAVGAVASFLQVIANMVGLQVTKLKREVEGE